MCDTEDGSTDADSMVKYDNSYICVEFEPDKVKTGKDVKVERKYRVKGMDKGKVEGIATTLLKKYIYKNYEKG